MKGVPVYYRFLLSFLMLAGFHFFQGPWPVQADAPAQTDRQAEIEKFVKARIDLGESMRDFFRKRGGAQRFGPGGDTSMEELKRMEEEINTEVGQILAKHGLTIQEYQERSPDVLGNKAELQKFLDANPDLKQRYEALPPAPPRGRR